MINPATKIELIGQENIFLPVISKKVFESPGVENSTQHKFHNIVFYNRNGIDIHSQNYLGNTFDLKI